MKDLPTSAHLDFHLESLSLKTQNTPQLAVDSTAAVPLQVEKTKGKKQISEWKKYERFLKAIPDQLSELKRSLISEFEGQSKPNMDQKW